MRINVNGSMSLSLVLTDTLQANCHLLGRDILDHFALICDREAGFVTLLRPPHHYTIQG